MIVLYTNSYFLKNCDIKGWKAFESDKNRYWLAHDLLDSRYSDFHAVMDRYHRQGLDKLGEEPEDARFEITEALENLKSIYRENSSAFILKLFFDSCINYFFASNVSPAIIFCPTLTNGL